MDVVPFTTKLPPTVKLLVTVKELAVTGQLNTALATLTCNSLVAPILTLEPEPVAFINTSALIPDVDTVMAFADSKVVVPVPDV